MSSPFKKLHLYLNQNYEGLRFWVAMVTAVVVIGAILIQNQRAIELGKVIEAQNKAIQSQQDTIQKNTDTTQKNTDKLIGYIECITKVFIAPADQVKSIEGEINDPVTALEKCRIEANGVITPPVARAPASATIAPEPSGSITADSEEPSNQGGSSGSEGNSEPPEEPPPPPPPVDEGIIPDDIPIIGRLL